MKKISLNEVMERSTEAGIIVKKYKEMRYLQKTLLILMDSPEPKAQPNSGITDLKKMYYVQDYKNNQFYYRCTEDFYEDLKVNVDEYISTLISSVTGMVEVKFGLTTEMKSSKEMIDSFKSKVDKQEVIITEV